MARILIIDDSNSPLELTRIGFGEDNSVKGANSVIIAVNILSKDKYDLLIVNLDMESASGGGILKKAKTLISAKDVPVIALTRDVESVVAENARLIEGVEMLEVPYEKAMLLDMIMRLANIESIEEEPVYEESDETKVMIVDDDEVMLDTLKLYLEKDYRVITANSGREALDILDSGDVPNVILLDVRMPGMDGISLFKKIKSNVGFRNIPVIFQTGISDVETVKECISIGTEGYIVKPVKKSLLISKIESAISSHDVSKKHILVIERDMITLNIMKHHLQDDYKVSLEYSVPLALAFLSNQNPDLIIMDDENPCSSFYKLRSKKADTPILLLSEVCTDEEALDKCLAIGAMGVIKDTYNKIAVLKTISRVLG